MIFTKTFNRITSLLFLISAVLLIFFPLDLAASDKLEAHKIKVDLAESAQSGQVEILILLKEQADAIQAADIAEMENIFSFRNVNSQKGKEHIRASVVKELRETADKSQVGLLKFLKREKEKGTVLEYSEYSIVNMIYARVTVELVEKIALRYDVDSIWENEQIELFEPVGMGEVAAILQSNLEWNIERIGAPQVWQELECDGSGVTIGIIDSGVDLQHEALKRKYRGYDPENPQDFDHAYNWLDLVGNSASPVDSRDHGTFVTGIALGSGDNGENQIGVAPGANWIAARAIGSEGGSQKDILEAMEWMLAPTPNADGSGEPDPSKAPDIINCSWGMETSGSCYADHPFRTAIKNWRAAGILPVFAAGNSGDSDGSIVHPAAYEESFAVGMVNNEDVLDKNSSRGPSPCGSFIKPELVAPGVVVRSAFPNNNYELKTGTSIAAPHVAGAAALLLQAEPALSVDELEERLISTAEPLTDNIYSDSPNHGYGYGIVNIYNAILNLSADEPEGDSEAVAKNYQLILEAKPTAGGTVKGSGKYEAGEEVDLSAAVEEGYEFISWTEQDVKINSNITFTYTMPEKVVTLTANFAEIIPECEVTVPGRPSGEKEGKLNAYYLFTTGHAGCETGCDVEYRFDWGNGIYSKWGSGKAKNAWDQEGKFNVRAQARCSKDYLVVSEWSQALMINIATEEPETYTLVLNISSKESGSVSGAGKYLEGKEVEVRASPYSGFEFEGWAENGICVSSKETYSFIIKDDRELTATFIKKQEPTSPSSPSSSGGTSSGSSSPSSGGPVSSAPPEADECSDPKETEKQTPKPADNDDLNGATISYGDISGNGKIEVTDVVLAVRHLLVLDLLNNDQVKAADVNGDGKVDIRDVTLIMQKALGLIKDFPKVN